MRPEKSYLIKEASDYLNRSDYLFLTDYKGINQFSIEVRGEITINNRNNLQLNFIS